MRVIFFASPATPRKWKEVVPASMARSTLDLRSLAAMVNSPAVRARVERTRPCKAAIGCWLAWKSARRKRLSICLRPGPRFSSSSKEPLPPLSRQGSRSMPR